MNKEQSTGFRQLLPFSVLNFLKHLFEWTYMVFLPLHLETLGIPDGRIGTIISLFPFAMLLLIIPMGILSDIANTRALLLIASLLMFVFNYLISNAASYPMMLVSTFICGTGMALFYVSLTSLYLKRLGTENRGTKLAVYNIAGTLGVACGVPIVGYLFLRVDGVLFIVGYTAAALMGLFSLFMPKTKIEPFKIIEYFKDLKNPNTLIVVAVVFITASHVGIEQACYQLFLKSHVGLSEKEISIVFALVSIWMSGVTFVVGRLFNKTRKPFLAISLAIAISGLFQLLTAFAWNLESVIALRFAHTIGDGTFNLLQIMLYALVFPVSRMGGNTGFAVFIGSLSMTIFAMLGGFIAENFGRDVAVFFSGAVMLLAALFLLANLKRLRKTFLTE